MKTKSIEKTPAPIKCNHGPERDAETDLLAGTRK